MMYRDSILETAYWRQHTGWWMQWAVAIKMTEPLSAMAASMTGFGPSEPPIQLYGCSYRKECWTAVGSTPFRISVGNYLKFDSYTEHCPECISVSWNWIDSNTIGLVHLHSQLGETKPPNSKELRSRRCHRQQISSTAHLNQRHQRISSEDSTPGLV